jgi:hypothetical protein
MPQVKLDGLPQRKSSAIPFRHQQGNVVALIRRQSQPPGAGRVLLCREVLLTGFRLWLAREEPALSLSGGRSPTDHPNLSSALGDPRGGNFHGGTVPFGATVYKLNLVTTLSQPRHNSPAVNRIVRGLRPIETG